MNQATKIVRLLDHQIKRAKQQGKPLKAALFVNADGSITVPPFVTVEFPPIRFNAIHFTDDG